MYSFDIFDTLITRTTAEPEGIFILMQERLSTEEYNGIFNEYFKRNFARIRSSVEATARKISEKAFQEISIYDIYNEMKKVVSGISDRMLEILIKLEIETELENVVSIEKNVELVKQLINQGERVVLISDMYLRENEIRSMLIKVDKCFENIPIYVSNEYEMNKANILLYKLVKDKERVEYCDWIHYGDNLISDINAPEVLGIKSICIPRYEYSDTELEMLGKYENSEVQMSLGNVKNTWINCNMNEYEMLGCRYAGTIFYPFVSWILEKSVSMGIKQLLFIARDGYLLKKMADIIIEKKGYKILTSYVYGSRKAWRKAAFFSDDFNWDTYFENSGDIYFSSLNKLSELFDIDEDELKKYIYKEDNINKDDNFGTWIKKFLKCDDSFLVFLRKQYQSSYNMIKQYMHQVINSNESEFAFVDLRGTGYTLECLNQVINELFHQNIKSFYFTLGNYKNRKCDAYVYDVQDYVASAVLEKLCRAPHGQTEGYECKDGIIIPVLNHALDDTFKRLKIDDFVNGAMFYAKQQAVIDYTYNNIRFLSDYITILAENRDIEVKNYIIGVPNAEGYIEKVGGLTDDINKLQSICMSKKINDKNIIIYGSGKMGKSVYQTIKENNKANIVAWVDMNYQKLGDMGVESIRTLFEREFDYVVIAIANRHISGNVKVMLERMGIIEDKIVMYDELCSVY